jgi:hypothetical protein
MKKIGVKQVFNKEKGERNKLNIGHKYTNKESIHTKKVFLYFLAG